jgi:hypothetical protein
MSHRRFSRSPRLAGVLVAALAIAAGAVWSSYSRPAHAGVDGLVPPSERSLLRVELHLVPDAFDRPHPLLMTVGGPIYCIQIAAVARYLHASRLCTDYGPNGYTKVGTRALRREDWGDPAYDAAVAQLPDRLRALGVEISKLAVVGVSYSGYADAELVATHPELRPAALVVMDSYLDLPSRYLALPAYHETRKEIESVLGGTLAQKPQEYADRSPSHHLDGLAQAIRAGMKLVVTWTVNPEEQHEFNGATCSLTADAKWLQQLSTLLNRPVTGYVTELQHGHSLWDYGRSVLALAGLGSAARPLPATAFVFRPGQPVPPRSVCTPPAKTS